MKDFDDRVSLLLTKYISDITRSCAYWSMPEETYQEEILKSGKCWAFTSSTSSTSSKAAKFGLKRMKDTWQCGCNGGLCNGGNRIGSVVFAMLLPVIYSMATLL